MNDKMFCKNCGKELPAESSFCPYCMTKFTQVTEIVPDTPEKKKSNKKLIIAIVAVVCVIALVITGVLVVPPMLNKSGDQTDKPGQSAQADGLNTVKKSAENDNDLGLMNVKLRGDGVKLNDTQKLLVEYFDTDYFEAPYSSLQRYPQVYKGAQISLL